MEKVDSLENVNSQERLVVSIHIPKCGGTSMARMLCNEFKTLLVYQGRTKGKFAITWNPDDIIDEIKDGFQYSINDALVIAHTAGCTHIHGNIPIDYLMPYLPEINLITFVREPKERLHSEFCHNVLRFEMGFTEPDFYRYYNNSMYEYTRGMWHLFSFVGRFENYAEDIKKIGITREVHENKSEIKRTPEYPDELNKYTSIDQEIYNELN